MTRPYSMDLRDRVVAAVERDGLSRNQAAARFGIAVSTAVHWLRRYRTRGDVKPSKIGGHRKKTLRDEHAAWLRAVGMHENAEVTVLRKAPFGGPIHLRSADGGEFAIHRDLARCIQVVRVDTGSAA